MSVESRLVGLPSFRKNYQKFSVIRKQERVYDMDFGPECTIGKVTKCNLGRRILDIGLLDVRTLFNS